MYEGSVWNNSTLSAITESLTSPVHNNTPKSESFSYNTFNVSLNVEYITTFSPLSTNYLAKSTARSIFADGILLVVSILGQAVA